MNVYCYSGGIYCEDCGDSIRDDLANTNHAPKNWDNTKSYDSDDFPKGPYPDGGGEADSPLHCEAGGDCLNALWIGQGSKVGAFLENPLTKVGEEYMREAIKISGKPASLWIDFYETERDNNE